MPAWAKPAASGTRFASTSTAPRFGALSAVPTSESNMTPRLFQPSLLEWQARYKATHQPGPGVVPRRRPRPTRRGSSAQVTPAPALRRSP